LVKSWAPENAKAISGRRHKEPERKKDLDMMERFRYKSWPLRCRQKEIAEEFLSRKKVLTGEGGQDRVLSLSQEKLGL
jgi:hypothetical protein